MESTLDFEFECFNLPGAVNEQYRQLRLGIQLGKQVVMDVPADGMVAYFPFSLKVSLNPSTGAPRFTGSYAQGPSGNRFVYLCWGTRDSGREWTTVARAKIPLYTLSWDIINWSLGQSAPIRARIRMTNRAGEPVAATINSEDLEWLRS